MPVTPTYPGVYIEEIPSGVRTITGVSTSVTAFIGYVTRGRMDEPTQIFNFGDFEREFGGLNRDSEMSYAVKQFFLNGGTEAQIVRTAKGAKTATIELYEGMVSGGGGSKVLEVEAASAGEWGNNLRLDVDYDTPESDRFNLTVGEYADPSKPPVQVETFRNLSMAPDSPRFVKDVLNEGSELVYVSQDADDVGSYRPLRTGTVGGSISSLTKDDGTVDESRVDKSQSIKVEVDVGGNTKIGTFSLKGTDVSTLPKLARALQEKLRGVDLTRSAGRDFVADLSRATVQVVNDRLHVKANAEDTRTILDFSKADGDDLAMKLGLRTTDGAEANVQQYSLGIPASTSAGAEKVTQEGHDGSPPDAKQLTGSRNDKTGLYALEDADIFNILCIPRTAALEGGDPMTVVGEALAYCEERRAFMIVDIPDEKAADEVDEVKAWLSDNATTLRHDHAAFYFPRVKIADPLNEFRPRTVAASGTMAGLYARTDTERGVWKAPAGTEAVLRGVRSLEYKLSDPENGTLNEKGINALRTFPVYGNVSWGARTGRGADQLADEYKYIPVRRLALFIEQSLFRGLQWVVFEPNDEPLWAQIRLNVGDFMHGLFRQGAFQGSSPGEAYFVKCDSETTTQNDINRGIVNILVGFAPLKPAEFVILKLQQMAGQEA